MRAFIKRLPIVVSLAMLALAVFVKAQQFSFIEQLQNKVFDQYQMLYPRTYEPAGVKIIDIDDESLQRLGHWPWSRTLLAKLVDRLTELGASVMAFDIVFAEADGASPETLSQLWDAKGALKDQLASLPDPDAQFAQALSQSYGVMGFVMTNEHQGHEPVRKYGMSFAGLEGSHPSDFLLNFSNATTNLPALQEAAEGNGFFNNTPDADGIVRRVPLALTKGKEVYFSLAMEALRVAQGASSYIIKMAGASGEESFGEASGITSIRNGKFTIPTDANGNFLVHYTEFQPSRYIPAWKVLEPDFNPEEVAGHILIFGTSAPGLKDLRATPLNPSLAGVEVHVQALEQILTGKYLYRPDWILFAEILMMVACGLILMIVMARLTAVWGAVFMMAAQGGALWFSVHLFRSAGYLVDPVSPGLVILLLYITESLRRYMLSESERKQVRGAFAQYMSPVLVEELAKHPEKLKLGGEMKDLTVLFCDIRGFTTISERFNAQQLTTFINRFLTPMSNVILSHKGTIDKYMGDCIMAFWNAPLDDPHHARNGCLSALKMFEALDQFNAERKVRAAEEGWEFFAVGIGAGLNSGEICVGNMGSEQRFDYSVLGDDVNLASRLEGQSKTYGVNIVIGQNTQVQIPEFATLELDQIKVKGKTKPVTIFALLGDETLAENPEFKKLQELWNGVLKSYRAQRWDEAENFISLCRTHLEKHPVCSLDGLFELYEERLAAYRITPPGDSWDGVYEAKTK